MMENNKLERIRVLLGDVITWGMEEKGMSCEELASATGMKPETIERIEEGKFWPNFKQVVLIFDALGIPLQTEGWKFV